MMRAVAHMDPQHLRQGEIAERGMLHEQIIPASRQELVRQRDKARHAFPQLPLHRARIGTLAGSVVAGARRPEGIHPTSRYTNWRSRCRSGLGRRRQGGLARRSSNTRPLPSIEMARWWTI